MYDQIFFNKKGRHPSDSITAKHIGLFEKMLYVCVCVCVVYVCAWCNLSRRLCSNMLKNYFENQLVVKAISSLSVLNNSI